MQYPEQAVMPVQVLGKGGMPEEKQHDKEKGKSVHIGDRALRAAKVGMRRASMRQVHFLAKIPVK